MKRQLFYFVAAVTLTLSNSTFAQAETRRIEADQAGSSVSEARTRTVGRSRAEVISELVCARASGELALLHSEIYDDVRAAAVHERAAHTPVCQEHGTSQSMVHGESNGIQYR